MPPSTLPQWALDLLDDGMHEAEADTNALLSQLQKASDKTKYDTQHKQLCMREAFSCNLRWYICCRPTDGSVHAVDKDQIIRKLSQLHDAHSTPTDTIEKFTHPPDRVFELLKDAIYQNDQQWASKSQELEQLLDENVTVQMLDGTTHGPGRDAVRTALNDTVKLVFERLKYINVSPSKVSSSTQVSKVGPHMTRDGTVELQIHLTLLLFNVVIREFYTVNADGRIQHIARFRR